MKDLNQTINKIIKTLSFSKRLAFNECSVVFTDSQIITPIGDIIPVLFNQKSKLSNEIVDLDLLKNLIFILNKNDSIIRLNHVGFGYVVKSKQLEKQRLINLTKKTDKLLYEEESNDFGLWLFLGDTNEWERPLIEFVPVQNNEPNTEYFLPHIQIDIDTTLSLEEIEGLIKKVFKDKITSFHIAVINGITYIVRNRLGVINGVNIFIDLATKSRNVKLHRQNCLKQIS